MAVKFITFFNRWLRNGDGHARDLRLVPILPAFPLPAAEMDLQTSRLRLRELTAVDLDAVHRLHSLPEVDEFNTLGIPADVATTERLLAEW